MAPRTFLLWFWILGWFLLPMHLSLQAESEKKASASPGASSTEEPIAFDSQPRDVQQIPAEILGLAFSPNGKTLAAARGLEVLPGDGISQIPGFPIVPCPRPQVRNQNAGRPKTRSFPCSKKQQRSPVRSESRRTGLRE